MRDMMEPFVFTMSSEPDGWCSDSSTVGRSEGVAAGRCPTACRGMSPGFPVLRWRMTTGLEGVSPRYGSGGALYAQVRQDQLVPEIHLVVPEEAEVPHAVDAELLRGVAHAHLVDRCVE